MMVAMATVATKTTVMVTVVTTPTRVTAVVAAAVVATALAVTTSKTMTMADNNPLKAAAEGRRWQHNSKRYNDRIGNDNGDGNDNNNDNDDINKDDEDRSGGRWWLGWQWLKLAARLATNLII